MGGQTTSSSSSSSSSSSQSSGARGHHLREERVMDKLEHHSLHHSSPHPPPPRFVHSRGKKHNRHGHRSHASPPSPSHHRRHFFEHPSMEGLHHHSFSPPAGCPQRHHHKEAKLRVKPPKHLKKIHKLHRKLLKAYKLPKIARHGAHHLHQRHCPPPNMSFFDVPRGHNHPPGCCLYNMGANEGPSRRHEMGILNRDHPRCHGRHRHPGCRRHSSIKPEAAGGEVAMVSPRDVKASADPLVEGATMALTSDMPPADQPEPVASAP